MKTVTMRTAGVKATLDTGLDLRKKYAAFLLYIVKQLGNLGNLYLTAIINGPLETDMRNVSIQTMNIREVTKLCMKHYI